MIISVIDSIQKIVASCLRWFSFWTCIVPKSITKDPAPASHTDTQTIPTIFLFYQTLTNPFPLVSDICRLQTVDCRLRATDYSKSTSLIIYGLRSTVCSLICSLQSVVCSLQMSDTAFPSGYSPPAPLRKSPTFLSLDSSFEVVKLAKYL